MLSVSTQYRKAINADYRRMLHRITFGDGYTLDQSSVTKMTLDENIGGNSGVALGTSNSASLKLTIRSPRVMDYTDMSLVAESGLELPDGSVEWIPLGKFYVTDSSTSNDYRTIDLTCVDGMYLMSGEYVSELDYPAHVREVAREIAAQAGVEVVGLDDLPEIYIRKKPEKLSLRNAIGYVAGCCGKNARFNRDGRLEFVWYKDTGLTIERRQQYLDGFTRLNDQPLYVDFEITGEEERYTVEVVTDDNGNVIATPGTNVAEGDIVNLAVVPFYGYELASIKAMDSLGGTVALWTKTDGEEYYFIQHDKNVKITASYRAKSEEAVIINDGDNVENIAPPIMRSALKRTNANVTMQYTNPLITSKMVNAISAGVESVYYTPSKVKHRGNPALEVGDIVTVPDKDGNYHTVLIMQQTMHFGGGMNAEITCPGQTEKKTNFSTTGALNTQIKKAVQEESYYQKKISDAYNSVVVSALSRSMSSISRQVTDDGIVLKSLNEWLGTASASLAALEVRVNKTEATVTDFVAWQDTTDKNIAVIEKQATENGASIGLVVKNNEVQGSVLVEAINGQSAVKIKADVIDLEGAEFNVKVDATNIEGKLTIGQLPDTVAQKDDIPTQTSDLKNDSDFAYSSQILTKLSEMTDDVGYQTEAGVTTIVNGVVTTDYVNALGISAKAALIDGILSADQIDTFGLEISNGFVGGFSVTSDGLELRTSGDIITSTSIDSFQAGLYYINRRVTVRRYGDSAMWYNTVYNINGAKEVIFRNLPANCEIFALSQCPDASHSVTSATDTSKAIPCGFHYDSPGSGITIDTSQFSDSYPYLIVNASEDKEPTVYARFSDPVRVAGLYNDGSFMIKTRGGDTLSMGRFSDGFEASMNSDETSQRTTYTCGGIGFDDAHSYETTPIKFTYEGNDKYHHYLQGAWDVSVKGSTQNVDLASWMQAMYEAFTGLQSFIDITSTYLDGRGISCPHPSCSIDETLIV